MILTVNFFFGSRLIVSVVMFLPRLRASRLLLTNRSTAITDRQLQGRVVRLRRAGRRGGVGAAGDHEDAATRVEERRDVALPRVYRVGVRRGVSAIGAVQGSLFAAVAGGPDDDRAESAGRQ